MKTAMFYDGGCPLCSREVAHYRRIDTRQAVDWIDIFSDPESLEAHSIEYESAMKHLHVRTPQGEIVRGAYAFHELWKALPGYRYLAKVTSLPGVLPLLDKVYDRFAERRFKKRMACANQQH